MLNNVFRFDIPTDYAAYKFKGRKQPWLEDTDGKQLWLIKAPNNVGAEHAPFFSTSRRRSSILSNFVAAHWIADDAVLQVIQIMYLVYFTYLMC